MKIRRLTENFSRFEDEGFFDWEGFEKFVNRYIKSKDDDITISTRFYRDNYSTKVQVTNGEDTRSYYLIYDKDKNVLTEYIDKSYSEEEGKHFSSEKEYADHLLDEFGYAAVYGRLKDGHPEWDSGIDNFIEIAKYARRNPADWDDFMHDFLKVFNTYNYKDDRLEWLSAEIYPSKRHGTFEAELHAYTRHPRERTISDGEYVYDIQWDGKNNEWIALNSRYESVKQLARDIYKDLEKNGWLNSYKDDESIERTKSNSPLKEAFEEDINTIKDVIDTIENIYSYDNKQFTQKQYYDLEDILGCLRNGSLQDAEDKLYSLVHYHNKNLKKNTYFKLDRCLDVITEINVESDDDGWWDQDEDGFIDPDQVIDNLKSGAYDESIKIRKPNFPLKERKDNDIEQRHISLGELKRIFKGYKFV